MTVAAGTFPTTMRKERKTVLVVHFTQGSTATVIQTNTAWYAPDVGGIKEIIEVGRKDEPAQASLILELSSYAVNGQGGG
jgi:hypothetical protein